MINRFNMWYDRLPEPWRFLLFISVMACAIFPLQLGLAFHVKSMAFFGLGLFTIVCIVGTARAFGLGGRTGPHKYIGLAMLLMMGVVAGASVFLMFA